jgi:hypothetical protein
MGMHHGVIAANGPAPRLIAALNAHVSQLVPGSAAARLEDLGADDEGWHMAYGERDGKTFVFDTSFVLSADFDLLAACSRDLNDLVIGWGAETVSGSYWFVANRSGDRGAPTLQRRPGRRRSCRRGARPWIRR